MRQYHAGDPFGGFRHRDVTGREDPLTRGVRQRGRESVRKGSFRRQPVPGGPGDANRAAKTRGKWRRRFGGQRVENRSETGTSDEGVDPLPCLPGRKRGRIVKHVTEQQSPAEL